MDFNNTEKKETAFNSGLAKLERIHDLRRNIHNCRMNPAIKNRAAIYLNALKGLYSEMGYKFSEDEKVKVKEMIGKCIYKVITETSAGKQWSGRSEYSMDNLYELELYMSELENRYGFGMPDKKTGQEATYD